MSAVKSVLSSQVVLQLIYLLLLHFSPGFICFVIRSETNKYNTQHLLVKGSKSTTGPLILSIITYNNLRIILTFIIITKLFSPFLFFYPTPGGGLIIEKLV